MIGSGLLVIFLIAPSPAGGEPGKAPLAGEKGAGGKAVEGKAKAGPKEAPSEADYEKHAAALRKKLPRGFSLVVERPFVVVGDLPEPDLRSLANHTVRWSVSMLKGDYFERDPEEIIDIWLFRDAGSYRKGAKEIFGDEPSTPYGYYSETHKALIMNIATGGGTLVHEIVHPFLRANFPGCPAWFSEGLASLYEQSEGMDGHIRGLTNWRLEGLQEAIRARRTIPFEKLLSTTDGEFYGDRRGINYAQARYLCYYLQEKGSLVRFYKTFRGAIEKDRTGIATLKKVLETEDLEKFRKSWEKYVLGLGFP